MPVKKCPKCFIGVPTAKKVCPRCHYVFLGLPPTKSVLDKPRELSPYDDKGYLITPFHQPYAKTPRG